MGPRTKYEDTVYEKVPYSGKIFMYSSTPWNVLFPIVDIIRSLKRNTIIGYKYGKGQQIIKLYSPQYNHCLLGYDLKNKKDYLENLKAVRNIFIFSDEQDAFATNLISVASKNKINVICYSNLDTTYHFYDNINGEKADFKKPEQVLEKMYNLMDLEGARKIAELFPDFEIIDPPVEAKHSSLEECNKILKDRENVRVKLYDPNLSKLKYMEYERSQKNMVYPDSMEVLAKKEENKRKTLLSRFFKKSV
jgi:hypothetical protein